MLLSWVVLIFTASVCAAQIDLQALVDAAAVGDTLQLRAGRYSSAEINKKLSTRGLGEDTVLEGGGSGHVLALRAEGIAVSNLRVVDSGTDVTLKESGIWVDRTAPNVKIDGVRVERCGFGIWIDMADGAAAYWGWSGKMARAKARCSKS